LGRKDGPAAHAGLRTGEYVAVSRDVLRDPVYDVTNMSYYVSYASIPCAMLCSVAKLTLAVVHAIVEF
jgi:hypothetical protein